MSMGVETRRRPCHSAAHCRHMKRQPSLCHCRPCRGRCHCNRCCHLHHCCQLCCHCRCCPPSPLPLAIVIAVAVDHCHHHLCCVAVSHRRYHRPCCRRRPCCRPLLFPSPSAIAVAISLAITIAVALGHFQELLPWRSKNCIQLIKAKNTYLILFCLVSGWRTDQSQMADQVSSGDGQHQRWAASGKHRAASERSGWQQGGSRGPAGWRR